MPRIELGVFWHELIEGIGVKTLSEQNAIVLYIT
jgi:hypothetical protein